MKAIILAGGFGTRLRSVVSDVPKPLAPIEDKPFLDWLIHSIALQGVTSVTLSVHHQWEKIRDYFDTHPAPIEMNFVVEESPLGTGGAMKLSLATLSSQEPIIVLNGDTFVKVDLQALMRHHVAAPASLMSMVLRHVDETGRYGTVHTQDGWVNAFGEGKAGAAGLINAGVYVLSSGIFAEALPDSFSFERDFLPTRLAALKPKAFLAEEYFIDIGIPEDYARAQRELAGQIFK